MRKIKFRFWRECIKRYCYDSSDTNYFLGQNGRLYEYYSDCEGTEMDIIEDNITIEFFTGLKDKNGKEIYEGDIVEYENSNAGYGRPRCEEINRDIIPKITPITYKRLEDEFFHVHYWDHGECEVIGNIHQNPELLKC